MDCERGRGFELTREAQLLPNAFSPQFYALEVALVFGGFVGNSLLTWLAVLRHVSPQAGTLPCQPALEPRPHEGDPLVVVCFA